jgi:hypothetical protein
MVIKKGLGYSELVTLKKLWGNANQFQKDLIQGAKSPKTLKSPQETKGQQNSPKKKIFDNKTEELHIKRQSP